jgi:N-acetylneuraminate synthase/N,N'-diacetyllegionaminate synthase
MTFSREIIIGNHKISSDGSCFITAEIGINHNGDMDLAKKMMSAAKEAGATGVKFQNYKTEDFVHTKDLLYTYKNKGELITESQWEMFKRCELSIEQLIELKKYSDELEVLFFTTPTSKQGIFELQKISAPLIKNGSDFLTNLELVEMMAETGLPTVLSTGMATLGEIGDAVNAFKQAGGRELILLHCTSSYPTPAEEVHLNKIKTLAETFGCLSGFSDHSEGTTAAIGARVMGACFIEKHFTLDKKLPGPDHYFSADPKEFKQMIDDVRYVEIAMGDSELGPSFSERESRKQFRLSCIAAKDLPAGTKLKREHIKFGRPGTGVLPKDVDSLINRVLKKDFTHGKPFDLEELI